MAVLDAIARAAEQKAVGFLPQNVSNILHGYAKLEHHPGHLMQVMAAEFLGKVEKFTPQVSQPISEIGMWPSCLPFVLEH